MVFTKRQLAGMMVSEKRALPEVAKAYYKDIKNARMVEFLQERGCPEVSRSVTA